MAKKSDSDYEADESVTARRAVVEGQAMVVFVDYILAPVGRTLQNTPGLVYQMQDSAVKAVIDSQMTHDAPMVLRETGVFPYRDGLIFENELLQKGGKHMAFAGAFARPPRSTHEVLQPKAYIENEKLKVVRVPDVQALLAGKYEVYDSGDIGELDVRALLKQFGQRKDADMLAASWQGGAYVTFRKSEKATSGPASTADLALLYVSRWKTPQAAEKFARQYVGSVAQRYKKVVVQDVPACIGAQCPVAAAQISTEEGPVIVEQWADSSVVVLESFDTALAAKLRDAVRENAPGVQVSNYRSDELCLRLYELPAFREFQERLGASILQEFRRDLAAR